jgi:hypothetical protein
MLAMTKFAMLALVLAIAPAMAEDVFPVEGDIGGITLCEQGADGEEDGCKRSCVREEKENEDEEDKEVEAPSAASMCVDRCAQAGYTIKQLNDTIVQDGDGNEEKYWRIELIPAQATCIMGCQCPKAIGIAAHGEVNDEGGEELPEEYALTFVAVDGSADAGYKEGTLKVEYYDADNGGDPVVNAITLDLQYYATVIEEDKDGGNDKQKIEKEDCELNFKISSGVIGGINSTVEAPKLPAFPVAESIGSLTRLTAMKAECGSFDPADENQKEDWCTYMCSHQYSVGTHGAEVTFVPQVGYINAECKCHWGIGYQNGSGVTFDSAQVLFHQTDAEMCTYDFGAQHFIANVSATDEHFNITHQMSSGAFCTYGYAVTGQVMGVQGHSSSVELDGQSAPKGQVVIAMILTALVIVGFCAPSFMK